MIYRYLFIFFIHHKHRWYFVREVKIIMRGAFYDTFQFFFLYNIFYALARKIWRFDFQVWIGPRVENVFVFRLLSVTSVTRYPRRSCPLFEHVENPREDQFERKTHHRIQTRCYYFDFFFFDFQTFTFLETYVYTRAKYAPVSINHILFILLYLFMITIFFFFLIEIRTKIKSNLERRLRVRFTNTFLFSHNVFTVRKYSVTQ